MTTLGELLRARGTVPDETIAIRTTLHPDDVSSDFRSIEDVRRAAALSTYDRMQDGPRFGNEARVLSFIATDNGGATLTAFRHFTRRERGNVPGDIVYDYDAAPLLHAFIARAAQPVFYDARDLDALDDLIGRLAVRWPEPLSDDILPADHAHLMIVPHSAKAGRPCAGRGP
ncbi:MAG: hypothetical protein M9932_16305 [Xanthobacteraceae bacterium]|nr:hypothetical protein [Xanthobacteraceae bacterium]